MNGTTPPGRTIVTGAAGLIGSALLWELNRRGVEDAIVVDRLGRSEKWRHLVPLHFSEYLEAEEFYPKIAEHPDVFGPIAEVYHLGACSATTERDATYLIANNYRLSQDLARWALGHGARFVYASSAATYGSRETDLREDLDPYSLAPLNMYGYSKQLFDLWARNEGILERIVGLKFFNVYGPNEDHKGDMRSVVAKAYEQIVSDGTVRLFESYRAGIRDGEQTRDFLYVKDAVAIALHLGRLPRAGGLYNVGSGTARSWNDLAAAIFTALERPKNITYIAMPDALRGKYQYRTEASVGKLRASGYTAPFVSLEEGVWEYICRYLVPGVTLGAELPSPTGAGSARSTPATR